MEPRACPECGGLFVISGMERTQVDLNPAAPVLLHGKRSDFPIGACPRCGRLLTSDAFPAGGQLVPWNAPMLESVAEDVAEGTPLRIRGLATKMSQDDVAGYAEERNRQAAWGGRRG